MDPADPTRELALYEALRVGRLRAFRALVEDLDAPMVRLAGWYAPGEERRLVRATWATALGGLSMFTWHTTFRAWLVGILVAHARAVTGQPAASGPARILGPAPTGGGGIDPASAGDLPWSAWWGPTSWDAVRAAVWALPATEREVVVVEDVERWPADEVRALLGLTIDDHARATASARAALGARLAGELDGPPTTLGARLRDDPSSVAGLLAAMPQTEVPPPPPELAADFRRWRAERGLTALRRLRARPRVRGGTSTHRAAVDARRTSVDDAAR